MWRDIEITSVSSVAKLCYAILASFESDASHLFSLKYDEERYEIQHPDDWFGEPVIDPTKTKLSSLNLAVKDVLEMDYDFGAGWEFEIVLVSITEMKKGTGKRYPRITAGKGRGIIEDMSPFELLAIIDQTDKEGIFPRFVYEETDEEFDWDYREFDVVDCNYYLKDTMLQIKSSFESIYNI